MLSVSSRIWTRIAVSIISYDDNGNLHYKIILIVIFKKENSYKAVNLLNMVIISFQLLYQHAFQMIFMLSK